MSTTFSQRSSSSLLRMVAVHGLLLLALTLSCCGALAAASDDELVNDPTSGSRIAHGMVDEVAHDEEEDDPDMWSEKAMKNKIAKVFPLIDADHDGYVSFAELKLWHGTHAAKSKDKIWKQDREFQDKNSDGFVDLEEILPPLGDPAAEHAPEPTDWIRDTKAKFGIADENSDGKLTEKEYKKYFFPDSSSNAAMREFLMKQAVEMYDEDKDGKLTVDEFNNHMYHFFEDAADSDAHAVGDHAGTDRADEGQIQRKKKAKALFESLDTNKDGSLSVAELKSKDIVLKRLHPTDEEQAHQMAHDLMYKADTDKNEKLSKEEMVHASFMMHNTVMVHDEL